MTGLNNWRWTASAAERRLIPGRGLRGPVPLLIAIMVFVMVVTAAAGLVMANASARVRGGIEHRYSIQIADGSARAGAAVMTARGAPGVEAVTPVPEAAMRRTLERWLGPAGADAGLPLPTMIDVDLKPGADPAAVRAAVEKAVPGARFVAHSSSLGPILGSLAALGWLAAGLVSLIAMGTAAAVVLAARGALDGHRTTIEVMHGIGATDAQVTRLFVRQIAVDSLIGGVAGAALAGLVLAVLGGNAGLMSTLAGGPLLGLTDYLLLAMLPIAAALLATLVARTALMKALRATP